MWLDVWSTATCALLLRSYSAVRPHKQPAGGQALDSSVGFRVQFCRQSFELTRTTR
jgi:hypothetical protein